MKDKFHIASLLLKYKEQKMNPEEMKALEALIAEGRLGMEDFDDIMKFSSSLDEVIMQEPSSTLDQKFYTMVGEEKAKSERKDWLKNWFGTLPSTMQWAMPFLLLSIGIIIGGMWSSGDEKIPNDNSNTKSNQVFTSLINQESTSDRLEAVNMAGTLHNDEKIVSILLYTLSNDKSSVVRIASIDALIRYGDYPEVREGLIDAIRHQTSPLVIQNIAEALKIFGENISIEKYRELFNKEIPKPILKDLESNILNI